MLGKVRAGCTRLLGEGQDTGKVTYFQNGLTVSWEFFIDPKLFFFLSADMFWASGLHK